MDIVNGELKYDMKHCSLGNGTTVFVIMAPSFQAGQGLEPWIQKDIQQHESLRWKKTGGNKGTTQGEMDHKRTPGTWCLVFFCC